MYYVFGFRRRRNCPLGAESKPPPPSLWLISSLLPKKCLQDQSEGVLRVGEESVPVTYETAVHSLGRDNGHSHDEKGI